MITNSSQPTRRGHGRRIAAFVTAGAALLGGLASTQPAQAVTGEPWVLSQRSARSYGPLLDATITDLARYWDATFKTLYGRTLPGGLTFHAGTPDTPPPSCGSPGRRSYRGVAGNAFYCGYGDFIAWDDASLFPSLAQRRGEVALALVLAHEVGHAVQARARVRLPSIYQELQADCFAGAWLKHVAEGQSALKLEDGDLDRSVSTVLGLRDRVGVDPRNSGAHGNGFDRASSLQIGFESGAARCARFVSDPPAVTASAFGSAEEARNGGDVDLAAALDLSQRSLNAFSLRLDPGRSTLPRIERIERSDARELEVNARACGGRVIHPGVSAVCPASSTVLVVDSALAEAHRQIGDLAVGALLAEAWSGLSASADDERARTNAACWSGAWLGEAARGSGADQALRLSPGDIDEAVLWSVSRESTGTGPFARVKAFRNGFAGPDACR